VIKKLLVAVVVVTSVATALTVVAQGRTPEEQAQRAVDTRKSVLRLFSFNNAAISGMARGTVPFDAAIAERNARRIAALAPMLVETFAAMDTRPYNVDTEALPVIWDNFGEFEAKTQALIDGANKFADIAARGNQQEIIGAVREFGSNCGSCHDMFREDN
jgi:cytochrome c556